MSLASSSPSADRDVITLDTATFTDFTIRCQDVDWPVNKCIVGRYSEVIRRFILANPTEHAFRLEHELATASVGRLLLRAMYDEKWDDVMDKHAQDLLRLAHFYKSDLVKRAAVESLKRQLVRSNYAAVLSLARELDVDEFVAYCMSPALRRLGRKRAHSVQIFVTSGFGPPIMFEMTTEATIDTIKGKVYDVYGVSTYRQRLMFGSRELQHGGYTLADYHIQDQSSVRLLPQLGALTQID